MALQYNCFHYCRCDWCVCYKTWLRHWSHHWTTYDIVYGCCLNSTIKRPPPPDQLSFVLFAICWYLLSSPVSSLNIWNHAQFTVCRHISEAHSVHWVWRNHLSCKDSAMKPYTLSAAQSQVVELHRPTWICTRAGVSPKMFWKPSDPVVDRPEIESRIYGLVWSMLILKPLHINVDQ